MSQFCFNSKSLGSCIKHLPLNFCELNFQIFICQIKIAGFESQTLPENLMTELKPVP